MDAPERVDAMAVHPSDAPSTEHWAAIMAYQFAFADPTIRFGTWAGLGRIVSTGVARFAFVIPLAGYLILYSDYFQSVFHFSSLTPTHGFLTFSKRIHFLYFGSVSLTVAYVLYLAFVPKLLRNQFDSHQFVGRVLQSHDYSTVSYVLNELDAYLQKIRCELLIEPQYVRLRDLHEQIVKRKPVFAFRTDSTDFIPHVLHLYFNWKNYSGSSRPTEIIGILACAGYILLTLPAVDLFWRVIQIIVFA